MTEQVISKTMVSATSDEVLLHQYVHEHSQQAFSQLVKRHAPLVWSVCRRIIHHHQSAEDAFQATFVVLMKQAPRLTLRASLSTWLYAVAVRIARRTQSRDARLTTTSSHVNELAAKPANLLTVQELIEVVKQEVSKLPSRYQPVMDLCFFQRLSAREASERLSQPYGAVRGCLQRGKKLLQERLAKRGITPLALATLTASSLQAMPIPNELITATQFMHQGQVPDRLLQLGMMPMVPIRSLVASLALVTLLVVGVGFGLMQLQAAPAVAINFGSISVLDPVKPASKVCGYVDDHEGKPVSHAKVEVYQDNKLEQIIETDRVGRFAIPHEWQAKPFKSRLLIVKQSERGFGWTSRFSVFQPLEHDVKITVLPLDAEIQIDVRNQQDEKLKASSVSNTWFAHKTNGSFAIGMLVNPKINIPSSQLPNGQLSVRVPIQTNGMILIQSEGTVAKRVLFHAQEKGYCSAGKLTLPKAGVIQGIATDPAGKPLQGVHVCAQKNSSDNNHTILDGTWSECITDNQGRYKLIGLEPSVPFNVMIYQPFVQQGQTPLQLTAIENVRVDADQPTELPLRLQHARLVKGIVIDKVTRKPARIDSIGYHGSARPTSSSGVLGAMVDEAVGRFEIWLPPGPAMLYCSGMQIEGTTSVTILDQVTQPEITIESTARDIPSGYAGENCTMGCKQFPADHSRPVQAEADTPIQVEQPYYDQLFAIRSNMPLPKKLRYRLYDKESPLESRVFFKELQGTAAITNDQIYLSLPELNGKELTLEIDAEGFLPLHHSLKAKQIKGIISLSLSPSQYQTTQCQVTTTNQKPAAQARVQIELQRLGTVVDSPWGPILLTDDAGKCTIEHLRPSDTFRLRVWGQDGSSAVTDWQQINDTKTINVQLK